MECEWEWNGTQAFEWYHFLTLSDLLPVFKVTLFYIQTTRKWYKIQLYLQWQTDIKSYMIYRTAPFSMTLNNPNPVFKVMLFFDAETVKDTAIVTMEGE